MRARDIHKTLHVFAYVTLALAVVVSVLGLPAQAGRQYTYPQARQADIQDDFHGTVVKDPYRWMEDPENEETVRWVEEQNKLFQGFIGSEPSRDAIEARITKLWNYPKYTLPQKKGARYSTRKTMACRTSPFCTCRNRSTAIPGSCSIPIC
jgi:protease II